MLRTNALLILAVVLCALATVTASHRSRKLFVDLEREQKRMRELEVEWGQLQLEQSTWAAHARVEKVARERLHMHPPVAGQVLALDAVASKSP